MHSGLVICLLVMLAVRVLGHTAFAYQSANKQVTAADAAKTFALEWRMEATAHVASLMVRDQQCKGDPSSCDLQEGASDAIDTLSKWAVGDTGWERLLSSASLYAIARHAYQEAEYDEAIIALEESLALRLFAYADQKTLDRWQQGLVMPGSLFRRQKMDLANTLVLRSDCLVQLAREQRDVDDLTEAMELLQLATALLKGGDELVPDSVQAISRRAATIASVAAELLPQLKTSRIKEVLEHHGILCSGCSSKGDYLVRLVPLLRLPVRVAAAAGSSSIKVGGSSLPVIEAMPDPFTTHATALLKKPQEHVAQYMQRVFFRLLTLVPADYLAELGVACRRTDSKARCISYLPTWVTAQAITIDKRTGMAHVSGPGACAGDDSGLGGDLALDAATQHPKHGSCVSGGNAQLNSEPFFVPGDAAGSGGRGLPDMGPHNRDGIELCGFLHIRAIPPGVALPTTGGSLTPQQQKVLKDKAVEGVASGQAQNTPFKGVYYYFYSDIPALVDRIINTFDPEEADFLFEQLDNLTAANNLYMADRISTPRPKSCNEQALLEGKASPTCSVLVPNLGSCAKAPLKPPRRRIPMDPLPAKLSLPPPVGSYTPRLRARVPPEASWSGRGIDGPNGSGDRDALDSGDASSDSPAAQGGGRASRHHHRGHAHHHHAHFPLTDRELSDRQLQEQMAKLARDAGRGDRDDPLIPLTLAGCAVASFGLYLATKRRRRSGSSSSSSSSSCGSSTAVRLVLLGLGAGRLKQGSSSSGALGGSGAALASSGGSGVSLLSGGPLGEAGGSGAGPGEENAADAEDSWDGGASGSRQKRMVAAALRVAMNNTDTGKLEAALAEAEAADLGEAGLLQRARALLDKRRKKDQQKAAAEKAKLKALRKEEAKKGRKAAAKAAAAPAAANGLGQQQHFNRSSEAGDDVSNDKSKQAGRSAGHGTLRRLLQIFGLGGAPAAAADGGCNMCSGPSSCSLSRASSSSAGLPAAAAAAAAPGDGSPLESAAAGVANNALHKQQQQQQQSNGASSAGKPGFSSATSRSSSMSDVSTAGSKGTAAAAAAGAAGRTVNSHRISTEPSGSSVEDMFSTSDTAASPQSPQTVSSVNSGPSAAPAAAKSGNSSRRKGKGSSGSSNQQQYAASARTSGKSSSRPSAFDNPDNSMKSPLEIAAEIAAAAEARSAMLAQQALEKAAKQQKASKQAAAAQAAAAAATGSTTGVSAKQQQQQQQRSQAGSAPSLTTGGVTAPVTPPAVASPAGSTAARAAAAAAGSGQYSASSVMHNAPQHQQQQAPSAAGALPSAWATRQAAVSDDGSSSTCSNASKLTAASTPSKPKLNPKAAPYQPSPALSQAAKAAIAAAAAQQQQQQGGMFGCPAGSPASDWRGMGVAGGVGIPGGAFVAGGASAAGMLPMRGPSPTGRAAGWIGDAPAVTAAGLLLGSGNGSYHLHQQLGPADSAMDIGSGGLHHYAGGLVSYRSADQGVGPSTVLFDQGLTSPNHHHSNVDLLTAAVALSPHQQYSMHQQQQLLELLSAAGPGEARYGGIGSAGGSAPVNMANHGGSMDAYIAAHAATAAHNQRNSYSSLPDHLYAAAQSGSATAAAAAGGVFPAATQGGRGIPPGFNNIAMEAQQKQQQRTSRSGGLALNIDDDQLPPGFSAEDYTTSTPSSSTHVSVPCSQEAFAPPATMDMATATAAGTPTTLPSPSSIPTTAPLFASGSSVWAPLAATAGTAASSVAASMRALWPSPLTATSAAEHVHHHGAFGGHGYSRSQDLEVEVAAAATSANVAEHVLGTSPSMHTAGAADAQMSKLAKEIALGLLD